MPSDYRVSRALTVRFMGALLVLLGLLVAGVAALVAAFDLPAGLLTVTVVIAVVGVLGTAVALSRSSVLVRLDDVGYQVRYLRRAGVRRARWSDLEDVVTGFAKGQPVIVLRLRDGRSTTIPVNLLEGSADDFAREVADRARKANRRR